MNALSPYVNLSIDWNLSPTQAVTMYLEWGNNDWRSEHPPVRSKDDTAIYFVVDTWGEKPVVRLVKRNVEEAIDLATVELPAKLLASWYKEYKDLRGIFEPTPEIKEWLKAEMDVTRNKNH